MRSWQTVWFKHRKNMTDVHLPKQCLTLPPSWIISNKIWLMCSFLSLSLSPFVAVCPGKHQNCVEHWVEKEFPWINTKLAPIANWYLILHQRGRTVWRCSCSTIFHSVLPCHRPLYSQHPLPSTVPFSVAQWSWSLFATKDSELPAPPALKAPAGSLRRWQNHRIIK